MTDERITWNPSPRPARHRFYSKDQFRQIIESRRRTRLTWLQIRDLCQSVNRCAAYFDGYRADNYVPPPSAVRDHMRVIETALSRVVGHKGLCLPSGDPFAEDPPHALREALIRAADDHAARIGGHPGLPPRRIKLLGETVTLYDSEEQLRRCIRALRPLRDWASAAHQQADEQVTKSPDRHRGDMPLHRLLADLTVIYQRVFGVKPTWTVNPTTRAVGGPFARFLNACLEPLGEKRDFDSLRGHWQRAVKGLAAPSKDNKAVL